MGNAPCFKLAKDSFHTFIDYDISKVSWSCQTQTEPRLPGATASRHGTAHEVGSVYQGQPRLLVGKVERSLQTGRLVMILHLL